MEYFFDNIDKLSVRCVLPIVAFFDFDLTLSPLAKNPQDAFLPKSTKKLLDELSLKIPIGIISGRLLDDVISRVGIHGIMYAGNHGVQWSAAGKKYSMDVPCGKLVDIRKRLSHLCSRYPADTFMEDKTYTISFHYRMARKEMVPLIEADIAGFSTAGMYVRWSKKTFEVRPAFDWTKGDVCASLLRTMHEESALPVYVGDDLTDEDAFRSLSHGITVRVGKNRNSKASYYIRNQKEINPLLQWLLAHSPSVVSRGAKSHQV